MSLTKNVQQTKLRYNNFNLSHTHDTSGKLGKLIPVQCTRVTAGDLFQESVEFNIRMAPLSAPAMARFNVHFHSFYVPFRILTPRNGQETTWEKFVMQLKGDVSQTKVYLPHFRTVVPTPVSAMRSRDENADPDSVVGARFSEFTTGSLWDYMNMPILNQNETGGQFYINPKALGNVPGILATKFLAYLMIWNYWYRRDQIEEEVVFPLNLAKIDLSEITASEYVTPELPVDVTKQFDISRFVHELLKLRTRNYERDYFTSGLPEPQFGDDVTLGGGTVYAAAGANISLQATDPLRGNVLAYSSNGTVTGDHNALFTGQGQDYGILGMSHGSSVAYTMGFAPISNDNYGGITLGVGNVEGLDAQPFSINELRLAMQMQGVREKINRGGTRYIEIMKSVHGVTISDLRIQQPQYLGGLKSPITIGSVVQTSESGTTPQGNLTGLGGGVGGNQIFRTKLIFEEDGYIMTIMSITPRTGYFGGIKREDLAFDVLDYYIPDFDHLGEQETLKAELFYDIHRNSATDDNNAGAIEDPYFAYNPRYEEYKAAYSTVSGEFRNTLDNWHVYREFSKSPVLSPEFIHAEPEDFDRIFMFNNVANTSNEHFYANLYFDIKAKRPMSKYSTPFTFY